MATLLVSLRDIFSQRGTQEERQDFMLNRSNLIAMRQQFQTDTPRTMLALLMIHAERAHVLDNDDPLDNMLEDWCARLHAAISSDSVDNEQLQHLVRCGGHVFDAWKRRDRATVIQFLQGNTHGMTRAAADHWLESLQPQPQTEQQQPEQVPEQVSEQVPEQVPIIINEYVVVLEKMRLLRQRVIAMCTPAQHDDFIREFDHRLRLAEFDTAARGLTHMNRVDLGSISHYILSVAMVLSGDRDSDQRRRYQEQALSPHFCPNPVDMLRTYMPEALDWCIFVLTR
jgi:hypothetical protein